MIPYVGVGLSKQHKQVWEAVLINALSDMIIESVGAGERHSVAVSDSGAIYAFGRGHSGADSHASTVQCLVFAHQSLDCITSSVQRACTREPQPTIG